jgi:hypothetical protein
MRFCWTDQPLPVVAGAESGGEADLPGLDPALHLRVIDAQREIVCLNPIPGVPILVYEYLQIRPERRGHAEGSGHPLERR